MRVRSLNHGKIKFSCDATGKIEELNYLDEAELSEKEAKNLMRNFPGLIVEVQTKDFTVKAEAKAEEPKDDFKGKKAK
jgi:hypothetical protein